MNCPRCGAAVPRRFCPNCGLDLAAMPTPYGLTRCHSCSGTYYGTSCPYCGANAPSHAATMIHCGNCGTLFGGNFCPICGQSSMYYPRLQEVAIQESMRKTMHILGAFTWIGVLIVFVVLVAVNIGYLMWGMSEVIPGIVNQSCSDCNVTVYVLAPLPTGLFAFDDPAWFLAYYFALVIAIVSSVALATLLDGRKLVSDMTSSLRDGRLKLSTNTSWAMVGQLFCVYLFLSTVYLFLLSMLGVEPTSQSMSDPPMWYLLFELANASVYEEIATRLVFLGLPLFLIALGRGVRGKPLLKELFGGSARMTSYAWALIFISAVIFGVAHIPAWDVFKLAPSLLAGLILGYIYVKKGIWAAILFHFAVDYYAASAYVSLEANHFGVLMFLAMAVIIFIIAGFLFTTYYSMRVLDALASVFGITKPVSTSPRGDHTTQEPQAQQPHARQLGFVCSRCGYQEAKYLEGKFQCLRCGFLH